MFQSCLGRSHTDDLCRNELWLSSVVGRVKCFCGRCLTVSYWLTWDLTHSGPLGTQRISTFMSTSISCSTNSAFIFWVWDILRRIPAAPCWGHLRLPYGSVDTASLWEPSLLQPLPSCCLFCFSTLSRTCPGQLVEPGSCRRTWTPIKYRCLGFCDRQR